jgi:hypothetical protein
MSRDVHIQRLTDYSSYLEERGYRCVLNGLDPYRVTEWPILRVVGTHPRAPEAP